MIMTSEKIRALMLELEWAVCKNCGLMFIAHHWFTQREGFGRCLNNCKTAETDDEEVLLKIRRVLQSEFISDYRAQWVAFLEMILNSPARKTCDDYD